MKRISVIIMAMAFIVIGMQNCVAQAKIFSEAAKIEGVTSVYISPMMLKLGASYSDLDYGLNNAVKELKAIEIVSCDRSANVPTVRQICNPIVEKIGGELLMELSDAGDKTTIYAVMASESGYADKIVVEVSSRFEYTVIYIVGKIDLKVLAAEYDK